MYSFVPNTWKPARLRSCVRIVSTVWIPCPALPQMTSDTSSLILLVFFLIAFSIIDIKDYGLVKSYLMPLRGTVNENNLSLIRQSVYLLPEASGSIRPYRQ
jgi:hypothetical protein